MLKAPFWPATSRSKYRRLMPPPGMHTHSRGLGRTLWDTKRSAAIRLLAADSSELAGRSATFVFVPAAYIAALAVGRLAGAAVRRHARAASAAALVVVLMLMFNGLANGWPPYWERLPGAYQVAGSERSVEPEVVTAAMQCLRSASFHRAISSGSIPALSRVRMTRQAHSSRFSRMASGCRARPCVIKKETPWNFPS